MEAYVLLPVFGGIILATYGFWLKKMDGKVDEHGERLSAIEAVLPKVDKQLDRIEEKLDGQGRR